MAEIVESLGKESSLDLSGQSTTSDEGAGSFRMSAEFTIDGGVAQFMLGSGSTGYTCYGSFSAPGIPNGTKLTFPESEGVLQIQADTKLEGTFGLFVFNMDSIMSQKGIFSMFFLTQDRDKQNIVAFFMTPKAPNKTLLDMPDLQGSGWAGWSGPV